MTKRAQVVEATTETDEKAAAEEAAHREATCTIPVGTSGTFVDGKRLGDVAHDVIHGAPAPTADNKASSEDAVNEETADVVSGTL